MLFYYCLETNKYMFLQKTCRNIFIQNGAILRRENVSIYFLSVTF